MAACKVINNMQDEVIMQLVQRETRIHNSLDHPNIVKLLHHFDDTESRFLVLELCSNRSLSHLIDQKSFTEYDECRTLIRQILMATKYLHEEDIIHRDLKPCNVLLDGNMNVKICDFGISIENYAPVNELRTRCGTLGYMAPEILMKRGAVVESDLWSIGVMSLYLYKGKYIFSFSNEYLMSYNYSKVNTHSMDPMKAMRILNVESAMQNLILKIMMNHISWSSSKLCLKSSLNIAQQRANAYNSQYSKNRGICVCF